MSPKGMQSGDAETVNRLTSGTRIVTRCQVGPSFPPPLKFNTSPGSFELRAPRGASAHKFGNQRYAACFGNIFNMFEHFMLINVTLGIVL